MRQNIREMELLLKPTGMLFRELRLQIDSKKLKIMKKKLGGFRNIPYICPVKLTY
jgi:hypothetical protein